jgi:hypothetical protein
MNVLLRAAPRRQSFIFDRLIFVGLYRLFPTACDALAKAAEKSGDKAKALEYSEKIVAIAGGADKTRTEVADARASLEKR